MFFQQLIDPDLGCACYVLGDGADAVVVDPGLDVDRVLAAVATENARVAWILETHVHADHVSGRALLAAATGARVRVPAGGGVDPAAGDPLQAGDVITAGAVRIEAIAAPGHRPEHLALAVTDTARHAAPGLLLTGDSLLVGDLARPDLAIEPAAGARDLHATLGVLTALGPDVEVWPGHIGGSLCGGGRLSRRPSSTVGYERRANDLLGEPDPERFAARLIRDLPHRPPTVETVVARNRSAAPATGGHPPVLGSSALADTLERGAVVVDGRAPADFDAGHAPGAISLPLDGTGLGTRAGWLLGAGADLVVCTAAVEEGRELARRLRAVGLDVHGLTTPAALRSAGITLARALAIDVHDVPRLLDRLTLVDVRDESEWSRVQVAHAVHVPLPRLREATGALPDGPLAVVCASGVRAATAASFLRRQGLDARRVTGGGVAAIAGQAAAPVAA